jgi:hypothetical protein
MKAVTKVFIYFVASAAFAPIAMSVLGQAAQIVA